MKIGVISDIHSNYFALKTVLDFLEDKIETLICAGDFVGYGPQPTKCIDAFNNYPLPTFFCLGNHDLGVRFNYSKHSMKELIKEDFNILKTFNFRDAAADMIELNAKQIHKEHFNFLRNLPYKQIIEFNKKKIYLTHGTPSSRKRENVGRYLSPPPLQENDIINNRLKKVKRADNCDIIIIGHTHQRFFLKRDESPSWSLIGDILEKKQTEFPVTFHLRNTRIVFNPGSVGQPRDGTGNASFTIIDLKSNIIEFHDLNYPKEEFLKLAKKKCVPGVQDESFWVNKFGHFSRKEKF